MQMPYVRVSVSTHESIEGLSQKLLKSFQGLLPGSVMVPISRYSGSISSFIGIAMHHLDDTLKGLQKAVRTQSDAGQAVYVL